MSHGEIEIIKRHVLLEKIEKKLCTEIGLEMLGFCYNWQRILCFLFALTEKLCYTEILGTEIMGKLCIKVC